MEIKMMNNLKQKLGKSIENRRDELTAMADKIFDLSEVSGEEYLAYTTEESEKLEVLKKTEELDSNIELAIKQLAESKRSK